MKKVISNILLILTILITSTSCTIQNSISKNVSPPVPLISQVSNQVPLRFVVMSDSRGSDGGINLKVVKKIMQDIKTISPQPTFAIIPGDLVSGARSYSDVKAQLMHFKDIVTKYYPIDFFYPGFGNHEGIAGDKGEQAFEEVFSELKSNFLNGYHKTVYYFDKYNTRFYILNSNHPGEDHTISDTQLNWIKTNRDTGKVHNIYFFHEPAYPTGAHVGSSLDANKLQRDKFWQIIDSAKNSITFCGHEHNYSRRHIDSSFNETINGQTFKFNKLVYQITAGTFGAPIYRSYKDTKNVDVPPIPQYHYVIVDINEGKIQVTAYNIDRKIIDHFEQ